MLELLLPPLLGRLLKFSRPLRPPTSRRHPLAARNGLSSRTSLHGRISRRVLNHWNQYLLVEVAAFVNSSGHLIFRPATIPAADGRVRRLDWPSHGLVDFSYRSVLPAQLLSELQLRPGVVALLEERGPGLKRHLCNSCGSVIGNRHFLIQRFTAEKGVNLTKAEGTGEPGKKES